MSRMNWDRVRWESKLREPDDEWDRMNFQRQRAEQQACPLPPLGHQRLTHQQARALQALAIDLGFGSIPRLAERLLGGSHDLQTLSMEQASTIIDRAKALRDGVPTSPYAPPSGKPTDAPDRWIPARRSPNPKQDTKREAAPAPRSRHVPQSAGSLQALSDRALSLNLRPALILPAAPTEMQRLIDALMSKGQGKPLTRDEESLIERCLGRYPNRAPYLVWAHLLTQFLQGAGTTTHPSAPRAARPPCRREKAREEVAKARLKHGPAPKSLVRCRVCGCQVRSDRMESHTRRVHSR